MLSSTSALAALALWSASFVLMLRLALLERAAGGLDRLYWWHHVCGALAYAVLLVHPLAAALAAPGWTGAAALLTPATAPGPMSAGWLALLLLMAMMVATFWLPLAYARWRVVHAASAPAFALGAWHAWALGGPGTRVAVAVLSAISLAALAWRVALGRAWVRAHPFRVARVAHPGPGLLDLVLEPEGAALDWRPGQFAFVAFFDGRDWRGCGEYHPYTIAGQAPHGGLRMLVRALGDCTAHLQNVTPGVRVMVQGPYGAFLARRDPQREQLWIAGGIGITPFLAALPSAVSECPRIDLVHVRRGRDVALDSLIGARPGSPTAPSVRLHDLRSDSDDADALWNRLRERVGPPAGRQVFMCGPPALVDALRRRLIAAGVPPQDIHDERFDFR